MMARFTTVSISPLPLRVGDRLDDSNGGVQVGEFVVGALIYGGTVEWGFTRWAVVDPASHRVKRQPRSEAAR